MSSGTHIIDMNIVNSFYQFINFFLLGTFEINDLIVQFLLLAQCHAVRNIADDDQDEGQKCKTCIHKNSIGVVLLNTTIAMSLPVFRHLIEATTPQKQEESGQF